jgi:hypothetical protein
MALLGHGGILELSREWPEPMALAPEAVNYASSPRTITLNNEDYWTGDRVLLNFPDGTPYGNGSGNPPGRGMYYGGLWELSAAKQHVTALDDQYYQANDAVLFYDNSPVQTTTSGYIYSDPLGRIRLFNSELGAHNLISSDEIPLRLIQTGNFVLTRFSSNSVYTNAVATAANSIRSLTLPAESQELSDVAAVPAGIRTIADDPDQRGWLFQSDLQEWALDIDAANLDMTAIGETFGENTKALVRGAGSLQFLVDHKATSSGQDSLSLLRLVLLTQQGCRSKAKFWLYQDRSTNCGQIGGDIYYECNLLLNNSRINTRADALIAGSSDFVITGEIAIKIAA